MNKKSNSFRQSTPVTSQGSGELMYMSSMLEELKVMADHSGYKFLYYLIEMAEMHALELANIEQVLSIDKAKVSNTNNN